MARPRLATFDGTSKLLLILFTLEAFEQSFTSALLPMMGIKLPVLTSIFLLETLCILSRIQASLLFKKFNKTSCCVFAGAVSVTLSLIDETLSDNLWELRTVLTITFIWGSFVKYIDFDMKIHNLAKILLIWSDNALTYCSSCAKWRFLSMYNI